jgi:Ala-tRNA(Pro) deacylase
MSDAAAPRAQARPEIHPAIDRQPRPAARADLFAALGGLGIAHTTLEHAPAFTVAEGDAIKAHLPGGHTKNLFLQDKSGRAVLVCALGETRVDVNRLHRALPIDRLQRFSFGTPEALWETLGVRPGSVTAFALMNDRARRAVLVLDAALLAHDVVNFHPLENTATTAVSRAGLLAFVEATGRAPWVVEFADGEPPRLITPGSEPA